MTDTITRPGSDPEIDEKPKREPFLGLSPLQLIGGALAAITTAVATSYLGVAGTLIGAAVASVMSTVGAAVYTQSMNAAQGRIASGLSSLGDRRRGGPDRTDPTAGRPTASASDQAWENDALEVDTRPSPWARLSSAVGRVSTRAWVGTAAVFLMAIVAITGFELATGKPVSATVTGNTSSSGTTISSVVDPGSGGAGTTDETPTDEATPTDEVSPTDGTTPTDGATLPTDGATQPDGQPVPDTTQAPGQPESVPDNTQQPDPAQTADPGQTADSGSGDTGSGQQNPGQGDQDPAPAAP